MQLLILVSICFICPGIADNIVEYKEDGRVVDQSILRFISRKILCFPLFNNGQGVTLLA